MQEFSKSCAALGCIVCGLVMMLACLLTSCSEGDFLDDEKHKVIEPNVPGTVEPFTPDVIPESPVWGDSLTEDADYVNVK